MAKKNQAVQEESAPDEFHGVGGDYEIRDGRRVLVTAPTAPTDTGGARDADGKPILDAPAAAL